MSGRQLIRMHGIVKRFYVGQPNELEILHGIDLDVNEGEFVSIVGASGSGKSTLMNMIGVLDRPTEGTYWLDGTDVEDGAEVSVASLIEAGVGKSALCSRTSISFRAQTRCGTSSFR